MKPVARRVHIRQHSDALKRLLIHCMARDADSRLLVTLRLLYTAAIRISLRAGLSNRAKYVIAQVGALRAGVATSCERLVARTIEHVEQIAE